MLSLTRLPILASSNEASTFYLSMQPSGINKTGTIYSNPYLQYTFVTSSNTGFFNVNGVVSASSFSGSGASLTSIPNSALVNTSITINGTAITLGSSGSITAGATITDDTTSNATRYLMLGTATSGSYTVANTSSTNLSFNPSTGALYIGGIVSERSNTIAITSNTVNLASGSYFSHTVAGVTTFTVTNIPSSGNSSAFILDLTNGGSSTITWFTNTKWASGTPPTLSTSGRDVLAFYTYDGGTTWSGFLLGKGLA